MLPDTSTTRHSDLIVALAARHRLPAMYPYRDFVNSGGLLCYGVDRGDLYRRAASYVDRILRGAKPSDLPVQAPTKYELSINLKTAKALGLEVPPMLLTRADEVSNRDHFAAIAHSRLWHEAADPKCPLSGR